MGIRNWLNSANYRISGFKAGVFGGVALFTVIFFASGIPRIQTDILEVSVPQNIAMMLRIC
jgi:hypothetical protein